MSDAERRARNVRYQQAWRRRNRLRAREIQRDYYLANAERLRAWQRDYARRRAGKSA